MPSCQNTASLFPGTGGGASAGGGEDSDAIGGSARGISLPVTALLFNLQRLSLTHQCPSNIERTWCLHGPE